MWVKYNGKLHDSKSFQISYRPKTTLIEDKQYRLDYFTIINDNSESILPECGYEFCNYVFEELFEAISNEHKGFNMDWLVLTKLEYQKYNDMFTVPIKEIDEIF